MGQGHSLDAPNPEDGTGLSRDDLIDVFFKNIAVRTMVRRTDAEAAIESWEAATVGRMEFAPPEPVRVVRPLSDIRDEIDDEDNDERA